MRMLFTFVGGSGHYEPLLPIAQAARAAGHTVAFACSPSMIATVENAAFTVFAIGTSSGQPPERRPLLPIDMKREERDLREGFVRDGARFRAPRILTLCAEWQPDIIVHDETDFGGAIAAERLELPYATVLVIAAGSLVRKEVVGEALDELRAEHNLPPDPELTMLSRYLVLSPFPPSYRDPAFPLPATAHAFHSRAHEAVVTAAAPSWIENLPDLPTVYFTLGTIFNTESGDLFTRVLAGLRDLRINLIVTVGQHIDPAEFGSQPANVHIERYIPQAAILPRCSAVVSHGGSGSVMGALAHGLPSVLIPMGADQPLNAARCVDLGVAQVLDPIAATPESVRDALNTVLTDPRYRQAAERLRNEIAALPGPEQTVALLERLALEKRPIVAR